MLANAINSATPTPYGQKTQPSEVNGEQQAAKRIHVSSLARTNGTCKGEMPVADGIASYEGTLKAARISGHKRADTCDVAERD